MGHLRSASAGVALTVVYLASLAACTGQDRKEPRASGRTVAVTKGPAPAADFLVAAGDSTFWVTSGPRGVRMRGAPLVLARVDGRFYELYVADDDRSYYDAVFTGQRVYRRDLERGDSMAVLDDTVVATAARLYGATHPTEMPLDTDEDPADTPSLTVTGDVDILDAVGPFLSYEYHGTRSGEGAADTPQSAESVRRGVVDLRSGHAATVAAIFGASGGERILALGRRAYAAAVDSIRTREAMEDDRARLALRSLSDFPFDPTSFSLMNVDRALAVVFLVPGRAEQGGRSLGLPPVRGPTPAWWAREQALLPVSGVGADSAADVWQHAPLVVVARYDSGGMAELVLADGTHHEWSIGRLPAPIRRVYWLDDPSIDVAMRHALLRAFDESAFYSDDTRATSDRRPLGRPLLQFIRRGPGLRNRSRAPRHRLVASFHVSPTHPSR